jgi:glycosyltransferase involved in cell wall biosynthesis
MNNCPYFSIIIPAFNASATIERTLMSVSSQIFRDFEVILVDDGSSDNTSHLTKNFNQVLVKCIQQSNQGVSAARNRGAKIAAGRYVLFLDADDEVTVTWLLDYYSLIMENPDLNIFFCNILMASDNKTAPKIITPFRLSERLDFLVNVIPGSFCLKKDLFDQLGGFDSKLRFAENTELFIRLLQRPMLPLAAYSTSANLKYYQSLVGGSKNFRNIRYSLDYIIKKHHFFLSQELTIRHQYLQILGVVCMRLGEYTDPKKYFWQALKLKPFQFGTIIRFLISQSPFLMRKIYTF